ncbi:hypothetical protein G9C85_10735 [Halorubellus sp. JP-L1]|uniref:LVIVD repeat-containing protein n=1 Tax=Halorubellus sp. JP-L1 TaxID=2715753 RepID=UPI00140889FB|nr:hypothetical protein [Halorubellus sp. JP-L1]NHN42101.1 hypothetical protein [Halorubellus sp. JP-L1]
MDEDLWSPRRRRVLRAGASAVALSALGTTASAWTTASAGTTSSAGTTASAGAAAAAYAPRGEVDVDDAAEVVVDPAGETAFVAVGTGFVSVDVSDPTAPAVVGEAADLQSPEGEPVREVLDVKYDDGRVLVPTAAQGGGPRGFYVYDASDPANPTQVGEWFPTPNHGNHNAFLVDGVAYLTGGLLVDIVDVSGESFERLATWQPGDWNEDWSRLPNTTLHDLYVRDGYAYCAYWDAGVFVLDVSDPANPSFVSRVGEYTLEEIRDLSQQAYLEPGGNAHYVTVNEDATLLAEGGESWDLEAGDDSGGPSGITLFDVSEKANPTEVGHVDPPVSRSNAYRGGTWTTSHNFDLRNGRLYASWYQGGVSVHDVSDPANPERIAWWAAPSERAFWTAQLAKPGEFFVASSHAESGMSGNVTSGLLTFPDAAGEMATLPSAVAWTEAELEARATTSAATTTATAAPSTTTRSVSTTATPTPESTAEPTTESGASPGLGVLAALGGLGVGAARVLRGIGEE